MKSSVRVHVAKAPQPAGSRPGDAELRASEAEGSAPGDLLDLDTRRGVRAASDMDELPALTEVLDLARGQPDGAKLVKADDAVLSSEMPMHIG